MFASDKNVGEMKKLLLELKHYIGLQAKSLRLDAAEKLIVLLASALIVLVLVLLVAIALLILTFALAFYIGGATGSQALGFACVGVGVLLLLALFYVCRRAWVIQPVAKFIVNLLISKTDTDAGQLS